jgi:reductive dehalogenase
MKGLGLTGVGLGTLAATTPVFHDLDEVISSPYSNLSRPWWVKEVDEPTVEIDWSIMKRYDRRNNAQNRSIEDHYYGDQMRAARDNEDAVEEALLAQEAPGYTRKTYNFYRSMYRGTGVDKGGWGNLDSPSKRGTPEEEGVPKWTGTPEDNAKMLRSAARIYGAAWMGFEEVTQRFRDKLIVKHYTQRYGDMTILYEDVDQGYIKDNASKDRVLPTKQMYAFVAGAPEALFNIKTAPSYFSAANRFGGMYQGRIYASMYNFLRMLGYQMLSDWGHQNAPVNEGAAVVLSGIGEQSRQQLFVLTPEAGTRINMQTAFTDLPVAPTHPIDAGMWKFCHSCGKCADTCPIQCISHDKEPSWDPPLANGKPTVDMFSNPGPKAFWMDAAACRMQRKLGGGACHVCYAECTFNENREAMVHELVKTVVATTPIFNGFFANMSAAFGYGARDKEGWWDESLPIHGTEHEIFAKYHG